MKKITMHHILGNKVLEYDVDDRGVIIDEREYDLEYFKKKLAYEDFYGISFTYKQSDTSRTRIGKINYHKQLPIQSKMKGCTITSNGVIKYLNAEDWTKYEDGTDRDYTLNTMVEIPEFWALTVINGDNIELRLYQHTVNGAEHFPKAYCSAYEAYKDGSVLKSINDGVITPSVNINRISFLLYARANGSDNWNMYTYKIHKSLYLLYIVEYANVNGQLPVNSTLTTDGFRQGGIGSGATTGIIQINGVNKHSVFPCGCTDELGNGSGQITRTFENTDTDGVVTSTVNRHANRYRGVENPFGHIWKNTIDCIITYNADNNCNDIYYTDDKTKFGNLLSDYNLKYNTVITGGYYKDLCYTPTFELFVPNGTETGGSTITHISDYTYSNNLTVDRTLLIGGTLDGGGSAGWVYLHSDDGLGSAHSAVGSRLVYIL